MRNNLSIGWLLVGGRSPGLRLPDNQLPGGPEDIASLHALDWDCEGFGNPRLAVRGFPTPDVPENTRPDWPILQSIDLGADEMGELIIAGFIDGTRVLSRYVPQAPAVTDHTRLFFVNNPSITASRPRSNLIVGAKYAWWPHVQQSPFPTNFTAGLVPSGRNDFVVSPPPPQTPKPLFMRNLECDFSPHLFPDPHPAWASAWKSAYLRDDIHGAMPWYFSPDPDPLVAEPHDNAFLYYNPSPGYPAHQVNFTTRVFPGTQYSVVMAGILNSPGSALDASGSYLSAMYAQSISVLGPWGPCSGASTYTTNVWGLGASGSGCPDVVPVPTMDKQWLGHRYNAQVGFGPGIPSQSNLQTFLTVNGLPAFEPDGANPANGEDRVRHDEQVRASMPGGSQNGGM